MNETAAADRSKPLLDQADDLVDPGLLGDPGADQLERQIILVYGVERGRDAAADQQEPEEDARAPPAAFRPGADVGNRDHRAQFELARRGEMRRTRHFRPD